ncbi:MAG: AAA family ATPase [Leptospiraceae bacterium]|nr:AAA family ATPase [Leptospiraceae bacterium]
MISNVHIENIGPIKNAKIQFGALNLLCGKNNTGKTYIGYSIYGIMKYLIDEFFHSVSEKIILEYINKKIPNYDSAKSLVFDLDVHFEEMNILITNSMNQSFSEKLKVNLGKCFGTNPEEFINSKIVFFLEAQKEKLSLIGLSHTFLTVIKKTYMVIRKEKGSLKLSIDLFLEELTETEYYQTNIYQEISDFFNSLFATFYTKSLFFLPAERNTIQLFQKELDRLYLKNRTGKESAFSAPFEDFMDFHRDIDQMAKENSYLYKNHPDLINYLEEMLGVDFLLIDGKTMVSEKKTGIVIPHYMASTSVRSLSSLHFWLKHRAQKDSVLMIDEPELNLHPENQVKIARLLVRLVHAGIQVWISTHSDYIVKEINNMLMLSGQYLGKKELMKKLSYGEDEILPRDLLRAYLVKQDGIEKVEFDDYGMITTTFDDAITDINNITTEIIEAIENSKG